jgi:hypothetical protein
MAAQGTTRSMAEMEGICFSAASERMSSLVTKVVIQSVAELAPTNSEEA